VLGPPGGEVEHPTLQMPMRLPPAAPAPAPPRPASGPATAAPAPAAPASAPVSPALVAEAPTRTLRRADSGVGSAAAPAPDQGQLPDPPPLALPGSWLYPVTYDHGALRVGQPLLECVKRPSPTARRMGRFAFELWLGRELIERLRFDFPLLAAETPRTGPRKPLREEPSFAPGARVSVSLRMPASDRATSARILDRATGESVAVAWPPRDASGATPVCPVPRPADERAPPRGS
jgi:hypothetical protein